MTAPPTKHPAATEPLRLGFARGVSPNKWARRWAEAAAHNGAAPLELVPLDLAGHIESGYLARYAERSISAERTADHAAERTAEADASTGAPGEGEAETETETEPNIDVMLERISPGEHPSGTTGTEPSRRAVRLYAESVALVMSVDHELAEQQMVDRETLALITLLAHPDHLPAWPAPEPWRDESWAPADAAAAMTLVASGAGAILLPLPLARHLAGKRSHAVILVSSDPPLPGTEIWASWDIDRDAADVQQLVGVLRGRRAHSGRAASAEAPAKLEAAAQSQAKSQAQSKQNKPKKPKALPKNSRGAQLAAAKAAREGGKNRPKSAGKNKKRGGR